MMPRWLAICALLLLSGCSQAWWDQYHAKVALDQRRAVLLGQAITLLPVTEKLECVREGQLVAYGARSPTVILSGRHPGQAFGLSLAANMLDGMAADASGTDARNACLRTYVAYHIEAGDMGLLNDQIVWLRN